MIVNPIQGVEGDVAVLISPDLDIGEETCLNFDIYLVLSTSSSEDRLRITLAAPHTPTVASAIIYEITTWSAEDWRHLNVPLRQGSYVIRFEYTMGIPYRGVVAIDNVHIQKCDTDIVSANATDDTGDIREQNGCHFSATFSFAFRNRRWLNIKSTVNNKSALAPKTSELNKRHVITWTNVN